MKNQVEIIIFLLFGFAFLVYLFPFVFVEAAKLQSGVTINAPSTTETEKICNDTIDNDNDGKIDADDQDCAAAPAGPTTGTCGVQIVSGVPINYGQLTAGQISVSEKQVIIKGVISGEPTGTLIRIYIKGGNWVSDEAPNPTISGPEVTHVTTTPNLNYYQKKSLSSNEFQIYTIRAGVNTPVFFEVLEPANASSGSFHQEVTIDCSR